MRKLTIAFLGLLCACASTPQKPAAELGYRDCAESAQTVLWNPLNALDAVACLADMHRAAKPAVTPIAAPAPPSAE